MADTQATRHDAQGDRVLQARGTGAVQRHDWREGQGARMIDTIQNDATAALQSGGAPCTHSSDDTNDPRKVKNSWPQVVPRGGACSIF